MKDEDRKRQHRERIEYLHGEVQKLNQKMTEMHVGVDPQAIKDLRFEMLINAVLGKTDDNIERLEFEERFQEVLHRTLTNTIEEAEQQVRRSRLHVPGRGPNGSRQ